MDEKLRALGFREYDTARYLDTPQAIAGYLNAVLAENDPELLDAALDDIARARVMHGLAAASAEPPPADGRAFQTVRQLLEGLGMKLQVAAA